MKETKSPLKIIKNERGMLSAEFIFALVLVVGLCCVLFAMNFTLAMAEVSQYIAFSSARAFAAAHITPEKQVQLAQDKFESLRNNQVLRPILNRQDGEGWFQLENLEVRTGVNGDDYSGEYVYTENRVPQVGVRFKFVPKVLNMKIAFLGSTSEDGEDFGANITGFLIREPTQLECRRQMMQRYTQILQLDSRYGTLGSRGSNKYIDMEDNGC